MSGSSSLLIPKWESCSLVCQPEDAKLPLASGPTCFLIHGHDPYNFRLIAEGKLRSRGIKPISLEHARPATSNIISLVCHWIETATLVASIWTPDEQRWSIAGGCGEPRAAARENVAMETFYAFRIRGPSEIIWMVHAGISPSSDLDGFLRLKFIDGRSFEATFENALDDTLTRLAIGSR